MSLQDEVETQGQQDLRLVECAQQGDAGAFEQLVQRHSAMVFAVAYARLGDREAAEDLVQETFLRAYNGLRQLSQPQYFATWLSRIARNVATDWLRTGRRRSEAVAMLPLEEMGEMHDTRVIDAAHQLEARERERAVSRCLAALTAEQREIVLLHYAEDWSLTDISKKLNVHRTTVARHLEQALERLRSDIAPLLQETCKSARCGPRVGTRAAAAVAVFALLPQASRANVAAKLASSVKVASATAAPSAASSATTAGISHIATAASAAGGKVIMTKTTVGAAAVLVGLLGAGYYAKDRVTPYFRGGAAPPKGVEQQLAQAAKTAGNSPISIKPSSATNGAIRKSNKDFVGSGMDLQSAITAFYDNTHGRLIFDGVTPTGKRMDIVVKPSAETDDQIKKLAQTEIEKAYGVKVLPEQREVDVLVLRAPNGAAKLQPAAASNNGGSGGSRRQNEFSLQGATVDNLAAMVAMQTKMPVIDETGIQGRFNVHMQANMQDRNALITAFHDQLGLDLVPARRVTQMYVVQNAG